MLRLPDGEPRAASGAAWATSIRRPATTRPTMWRGRREHVERDPATMPSTVGPADGAVADRRRHQRHQRDRGASVMADAMMPAAAGRRDRNRALRPPVADRLDAVDATTQGARQDHLGERGRRAEIRSLEPRAGRRTPGPGAPAGAGPRSRRPANTARRRAEARGRGCSPPEMTASAPAAADPPSMREAPRRRPDTSPRKARRAPPWRRARGSWPSPSRSSRARRRRGVRERPGRRLRGRARCPRRSSPRLPARRSRRPAPRAERGRGRGRQRSRARGRSPSPSADMPTRRGPRGRAPAGRAPAGGAPRENAADGSSRGGENAAIPYKVAPNASRPHHD